MPRNRLGWSVLVVALLVGSTVFAQRGGRGGAGARPGGGGRGPEPGRGGGAQFEPQRGGGGGGFGGGLSPRDEQFGRQAGAASGPHGGGPMSGGARPGTEGRPNVPTTRPGAGGQAENRPGTVRPGTPSTPVRPGTANGTVRPGTATGIAGRPGTGGAGGPASGIGVLPGAGAGRPGVPAAANGTRYASASTINAQAASVRAAAVAYPAYSAASVAAYGNAWRPTTVNNVSLYNNPGYAAVAAGVGLSSQPAAYDYGANVVAQPTTVYVNGDAAATPQQYADQASTLASTGAAAQPASDGKWIPLGVFALVEGDATSSDDVFQLAVNPDGVIRGNYHNVRSDQMESLSGSVDKKTQRAAWTIGGDTTPVYEAGIANLTREATPILVHLGDGQSRQLTLVRLQQPQP